MKPCYLYVVRHGQSEHNRDNIISGHVNPALTEEGEEQAAATKTKLSDVHFDDAYSSDLQRASHTAEIIFGKPVPKNHQLHDLRERNYGSIDGTPGDNIIRLRNSQKAKYDSLTEEERWRHKHAPDIESNYELSYRFITALESIAEKHPGQSILVAAHGGTLRTMLIKFGYGTQSELPSGSFRNAGYVKLAFKDGQFTVEEVDGIEKK